MENKGHWEKVYAAKAASELHAQFGDAFALVHHVKKAHHTPSGSVQQFVYCYCRVIAS